MIVVTRNHLWLVDSHHKGPSNADVTSLTKIIAWLQKYSCYHLWDHLSGLNLDATANVWFNSDFILLSEFSYTFTSVLKTSTTNPCKKQTPSVRRYPHWHLLFVSFFPVTHTFILFLFYHVFFLFLFFLLLFTCYFFSTTLLLFSTTLLLFSTTLLLFFLLPFFLLLFSGAKLLLFFLFLYLHPDCYLFILLLFFLLLFFLPKTVTFFPVTFFHVTFFPSTEDVFIPPPVLWGVAPNSFSTIASISAQSGWLY